MRSSVGRISAAMFASQPSLLVEAWKELRANLSETLSDKEQLVMVTEFWSHAALQHRWLDWDNPDFWPTAWELMHNGKFDESSIALGMFYTLLLSSDERWTPNRMKLQLINDRSYQVQQLMLIIDKRWILNLEYNSVIDLEKIDRNMSVQQHYEWDGRSHSATGRTFIPKINTINSSDKAR